MKLLLSEETLRGHRAHVRRWARENEIKERQCCNVVPELHHFVMGAPSGFYEKVLADLDSVSVNLKPQSIQEIYNDCVPVGTWAFSDLKYLSLPNVTRVLKPIHQIISPPEYPRGVTPGALTLREERKVWYEHREKKKYALKKYLAKLRLPKSSRTSFDRFYDIVHRLHRELCNGS